MSKRVIIIGASGHGKVIADIVTACGDTVVGFLDDDAGKKECYGIQVLGQLSDAKEYLDCLFVVAIGNNSTRKRVAEGIGFDSWYTAIHPSAVISPSAKIGAGSVVMPNAVINADACIGCHCIINSGAVVEHDNQIGDYVHISPNAVLAGTVLIGEETHIGIGACVKNNLSICENCVIGAGSVIVRDIVATGVYAGVPARRLK